MITVVKQGNVNGDSRTFYIGSGNNDYNNLPLPIKVNDNGIKELTNEVPNGSVYRDMDKSKYYRFSLFLCNELVKAENDPDYTPIINPYENQSWCVQDEKITADTLSGDNVGKSISLVRLGGFNGENEVVFTGLSVDVKPIGDEIPQGSKFIEIDGGDVYRYNAVTKSWIKSDCKKDKLVW